MPHRILLVESDSTIRKHLVGLLTRVGHPCTPVASVRAALLELSVRPYGVIVADLDLGAVDGLADQLRAACPEARLIALQSSLELPTRPGSGRGFDTVIAKPFVADPLLAALPAPDAGRAESAGA